MLVRAIPRASSVAYCVVRHIRIVVPQRATRQELIERVRFADWKPFAFHCEFACGGASAHLDGALLVRLRHNKLTGADLRFALRSRVSGHLIPVVALHPRCRGAAELGRSEAFQLFAPQTGHGSSVERRDIAFRRGAFPSGSPRCIAASHARRGSRSTTSHPNHALHATAVAVEVCAVVANR